MIHSKRTAWIVQFLLHKTNQNVLYLICYVLQKLAGTWPKSKHRETSYSSPLFHMLKQHILHNAAHYKLFGFYLPAYTL